VHLLLMLLLSLGAVAIPGADAWVATWTQDMTRIKPVGNRQLPRSCTLTVSRWNEDGLAWITDQVEADGTPTHIQVNAKIDGTFYPVTGIAQVAAISYTRVDDHVLLRRDRRTDGAIHRTWVTALSMDGQTLVEAITDLARPSDPVVGYRLFQRQQNSR
jgi:hypothetical protein